MKTLEKLSNVAVIIVAIAAVAAFVRGSFSQTIANGSPRVAAAEAAKKLKGKKVTLPGADLSEPGVTKIVLSISTACHFCEESMPFYKEIGSLRATGVNFKIIAALPQDAAASDLYLKGHAVMADAVVSSLPLTGIGIRSTPTLIMVNGLGEVEQVWIGLLSTDRQKEVLSRLKAS